MKRLQAKKMLCVALAMSLTMPLLQVDAASTDIKGHWAEKTITQWQEKGLISGYQDGTFKPNKQITRAEFVHILNSTLKLTKQGEVTFSDVKDGDWFYKDIQIAVGEGYAKGTPENMFMPNATLTRAEAAVFIANILKEKSDKELTFEDTNMIPAWAKDAIALMVEKGYMSGYPDNIFSARKNLTRAEAVTILDKVMSQMQMNETKTSTTNKEEKKPATPTTPTEQQKPQAKKPSGGGGGGGGGSSRPSIPRALGARTVKNATELEAAVNSGYNNITVDPTGKIERNVRLNYNPSEELKITINKAQDDLDNIELNAPNATSVKLMDDGVQNSGTVLDTLTVNAPNAHVETQFKLNTAEIVRVKSSTFKALDEVGTINVQNRAKVEVDSTVTVKPNVNVKTSDKVELVGKYETLTTTKNSDIKLDNNAQVTKLETSPTASQNTVTGGNITTITAQSDLTVKDSKVGKIEIPSGTKKLSMNVQGTSKVNEIVNRSNNTLKLKIESTAQVTTTSQAKLEIEDVAISGTAKAGQTLTANTTPSNATVDYQWQVSDAQNGTFTNINGATGKTYTVTSDMQDKFIRVQVTGKDSFDGTKTSMEMKVEKDQNQQQKIKVTGVEIIYKLDDDRVDGELIAKVTPLNATVDYQWMVSNDGNDPYSPIPNGTNEKYTVTKDEAGKTIKLKVTGKGEYTDTVISSNSVSIQRIEELSSVDIEGFKKVGEELTAKVMPINAIVTYQWKKSDNGIDYSNIDGATKKNYRIQMGDKYLKVEVTEKYGNKKILSETAEVDNQGSELQLNATLSPGVKKFETKIKVTTSPALAENVEFIYGITEKHEEGFPKGLKIKSDDIGYVGDLSKDLVTSDDGEGVEITQDTIKDIEQNNNVYLTVYEIDTTGGEKKLIAYSSMRFTKDDINLPEKVQWEVDFGSYNIEQDKVMLNRSDRVDFVKNSVKVINHRGADITRDFDVIVKDENGMKVDDVNSYFKENWFINISPKNDTEGIKKYIYGEPKEREIDFKEEIAHVTFKEGDIGKVVGDKLTAKIYIYEPISGTHKTLEELNKESNYDKIKYQWFREKDDSYHKIPGENNRTYIIKEEDKDSTIHVLVSGDGVSVENIDENITPGVANKGLSGGAIIR